MLFWFVFETFRDRSFITSQGWGGVQKSVVYENRTPLKEFHMKIVPPPPLGDKNF